MNAPLAGLRIVEISSFVAAPLAGLTLAQLGAEVIRVDPVGGGPDYRRWPLTPDGESLYWTGLNKGKRSVAVDLRAAAGRAAVLRLITEGSGIVLTNAARPWHGYDELVTHRADLIHLEITGRADGGTAVDYTVNAATGFPLITGPAGHEGPVNHVLPAWDVACGLYAALAITAAVRQRDSTGAGARIVLPLENVALAVAGHLGFLAEAAVNRAERPRIGNALFGQYGAPFTAADGATFMIVALTARHFTDLVTVTGTGTAVEALAGALGADFADEGDRYRHRDVLTGLFTPWFRERTGAEVETALTATALLWDRYRSFLELVDSPRVTGNPLFTTVHQPGIGDVPSPGAPMLVDGAHAPARAAPLLGADTDDLLSGRYPRTTETDPS